MDETGEELEALQDLLDASYARAGEHLRGIVSAERRLDARQLTTALTGMKVLVLATVSARGEPRTSCLDGHFVHGRWLFTTSGTSYKARDLLARPAVSATHADGERLGVFTHGYAEVIPPGRLRDEYDARLAAYYGSSPQTWGPSIIFATIRPTWMVGYAAEAAAFPRA